MSENARVLVMVVAAIASAAALFFWVKVSAEHHVQEVRIAHRAARCVDADIWNERRIAECRAIAERTVKRVDELWARRYEPAKPTTGE